MEKLYCINCKHKAGTAQLTSNKVNFKEKYYKIQSRILNNDEKHSIYKI